MVQKKEKIIAAIGILLVTIPYLFDFASVEWEFLFFIGAVILYGIFRIDSRILILPAILTLAFLPFLLIVKLEALAETLAIYVYYLLVVGVILQIIEYKRKKNKLLLEKFLKKKVIDYLHLFALAALTGFGILYLFNNKYTIQITMVFGVYSVTVLLYGIFYLIQQDKSQRKKKLSSKQ